MRKRIIALALVLSMSLSFISFAGVPGTNEAIPQVYAYDFYFKDANLNVLKTNTAGDILAETYAYLTDDSLTELDVTLSIFVYYKNKIIAAESADETITKTATKITTPTVTVDSDKKDDVLVKAYLTTKDFSCLLAPTAVLGSSNCDVEKITVGEYEIFPEEEVYEYNITRFFKVEEITPTLHAYTTDLSTKKEVSSVDDNGVIKYTLTITSCDESENKKYNINVTPVIAEDTQLAGVEINGKTIKDFSPSKKEYTLAVTDGKVPDVTAFKFNSDAKVEINKATELPGTTTVKVSYGSSEETYTFNFVKPKEVTLTAAASYPYLYYGSNQYKLSTRTYFSSSRKTEELASNENYITYAEFSTDSLGEIEFVGNAKLSGIVNRLTVYEFYNTSYDSITEDCTYDEFSNGSAKHLKSVTVTKVGLLEAEFDSSLLDIKTDGKIKIALVDGNPEGTAAAFREWNGTDDIPTAVYLNIKYVPKNLSILTDEGFDISLITKTVKPQVVKGNASVTADKEWNDVNSTTVLKVSLDATFPSDCKDKNVLVKVLKPGISESDNKTLTEKYAYIYNTLTDSEGKVKESFNLSCDAGTYTIILSCNGYEKSISTTLAMPSADKMNELIDGLKGQTYDKDSLSLFMSNNLSGLSLDNSLYASFSEETRKTVSQYILDNIENYTAGGISEILNKASILLGINSNESNETVLKILAVDEIANLLKSNENYEDYVNSNKDELIPLLKSLTYNNYNDIIDAVYENLFIINLKNCADTDDITEVITNYRNYISQDCYMKYNGIFEEEKEVVNNVILGKLAEIDTILKLEEIILASLPEKIVVTEPSKTIHTFGFNFKNESNVSIKEIGSATKVKAEVYAELSDPKGTDIPVAFSIMTYKNGKLVSMDTANYTVTKDASLISAGYVNIAEEGLTVKAILTSPDMSKALSAVATLGSSDAKVNEIYIGNYKLPLIENTTEYSLTRYFDENEPVKLRVYTNDFASNISIGETENNGIITYNVKSVSSDGINSEEYKINLKAHNVNDTSLVGVEIGGNSIIDFSPEVYEYSIGVKGSNVPEVKAYKYSSKAVVSVTDATTVPGTTVISVSDGNATQTYKINFVEIKNATLNYADFICRTGTTSNNKEYTIRATSEPLSGNGSKVLYLLFDLSTLGNISIKEVAISGVANTNVKLYFYNSSYSSIEEATPASQSNFKEISDGLVSYLGEYKFSKGETATVSLDLGNIKIKDNKVMIMIRKFYGDTNAEDYGEYTSGQLKLSYIEKTSENDVISEVSDKGFDISLLDKGELTYYAQEGAKFNVDKKWTGTNSELKLSFTALFPKECANKNVYIKAIKSGIDENSQLSNFEKYAYIDTFTLDENGKLSEEISFNEASGDYKFVITSGNYELPLETSVYIPSSDKMETLLSNLQTGSFTNDTLYQYITDNKADLALDNSNIFKLTVTSAKNVCQYIIDNIETYTADGFNEVMSKGLVLRGINSLESNTVIEDLLKEDAIYSKLTEDKNYTDYSNLKDKTAFLNSGKSQAYNDIDSLKNAFYKNLLVNKVKQISSHSFFEGIINSYSDYITPALYSEYSSLTLDERIAVDKAVTNQLNNIYTIEDLESQISSAIDALNAPPVLPPVIISPAQSGGGGGGGLGNVTTSSPEITAPVTMNFSDVPRDFWGYSYIKSLYDKNIISGKTDTEFYPNDFVTRAEFTKMIVVAMNITDNTSENNFYDVTADKWYYNYVLRAVANGIIQGMSENSFEPERSISRQDASVMINRILKLENASGEVFADDESIADYAKNAIYALKENGIIQGYEGNFNPISNLTRAEAAVLINNILNVK